jgi:hypothetical protein
MKEFWKENKGRIKADLIGTVVGGIILAVIFSLSQQLRELAIKGLEKFQTEVTLPFYCFLTMFALGVLLTRLLIWRANKSIGSYYKDEVFGLVWEWSDDIPSYTGESAFNPLCLCPKCWAELPTSEGTNKYKCISCGFEKQYDFLHRSMLKKVEIEIDKRRRTGDWKQAGKRIKEIKSKS